MFQEDESRKFTIWIHRTFTNADDVKKQDDTQCEQYFDTGFADLIDLADMQFKNLENKLKGKVKYILELDVALDIGNKAHWKSNVFQDYLKAMFSAYEEVIVPMMERVITEKHKHDNMQCLNKYKGKIEYI